jgi:hypothetical protein
MVPARVRLTVGRGYGDLRIWGRTPDGRWWAMVTWEGWLAHGFEAASPTQCAGWASSDFVLRSPGVNYENIPRVVLDEDQSAWPPPSGGLYFGVLTPGQRLDPPEGMRWSQQRLGRRERPLRHEQAPPRDRRGR